MTTNRTNPQAGWADLDKLPRGPNGRRLCRYCQQEVPGGRRTFCSDPCVLEWRIRTDPGFARLKVKERDHGICACCKLDTERYREETRRALGWSGFQEAMKARGFHDPYGHLWEADHIVPVVEGGGECGLDGYRTLCIPCHKAATKALHQRLKQHRTGQATLPIISNQGGSHEQANSNRP